jgi:hypothetical protein
LGEHERYKIEEVGEDGEPIAPTRHAKICVSQCRVVVRDNIWITIREFNKPKADGVTYVDERSKNMLWKTLMTNFTLPPEVDPDDKVIERKVKVWTLKKVATQFSNYKKRLHKDYILKEKTPEFTGANV